MKVFLYFFDVRTREDCHDFMNGLFGAHEGSTSAFRVLMVIVI